MLSKKRLMLSATGVALAATLSTSNAFACNEITSLPITISTPGTYCLTSDHIYTGPNLPAIDITTNNVDIDLKGYSIRGIGKNQAVRALYVDNLSFRNGTMHSFNAAIGIHGKWSDYSENILIEDMHFPGMSSGALVAKYVKNIKFIDSTVSTYKRSIKNVGINGSAMTISFSHGVTIANNIIETNDNGLYKSIALNISATTVSIEDNKLIGVNNSLPGSYAMLLGGTHGSVRNNTIENFDIGIYNKGSNSPQVVYQNTLMRGGSSSYEAIIGSTVVDAGNNIIIR